MTPKEVRKLWVEALESGDYKKGVGWLRTIDRDGTDRFCCLGVLCDLASKHGVATGEELMDSGVRCFKYSSPIDCGDNARRVAPNCVKDWAGLWTPGGEFRNYDMQDGSLWCVNDHSDDFTNVIEIIKSEPEGLFVDEPAEVAGG